MWSLPIGENSGTIEDQVVQGSHNQKPSWTSLRSWTSGMGCRLKSPRLPSFPLQSRRGSGFGHGVKYLRWKHVCCGLPQASTLILYFSSYPHQLPEDLIWRHCIKKKNKKKKQRWFIVVHQVYVLLSFLKYLVVASFQEYYHDYRGRVHCINMS